MSCQKKHRWAELDTFKGNDFKYYKTWICLDCRITCVKPVKEIGSKTTTN